MSELSDQRRRDALRHTDAILRPLGFKKSGANWRQMGSEVMQQFSVASMKLEARCRPEWGGNILVLSDDRSPAAHRLQVRWILEMTVIDLSERLEYFECFNFGRPMLDSRCGELISRLLNKHVLPCFESFKTVKSIKKMMSNKDYPDRAQSYFGLPERWSSSELDV